MVSLEAAEQLLGLRPRPKTVDAFGALHVAFNNAGTQWPEQIRIDPFLGTGCRAGGKCGRQCAAVMTSLLCRGPATIKPRPPSPTVITARANFH